MTMATDQSPPAPGSITGQMDVRTSPRPHQQAARNGESTKSAPPTEQLKGVEKYNHDRRECIAERGDFVIWSRDPYAIARGDGDVGIVVEANRENARILGFGGDKPFYYAAAQPAWLILDRQISLNNSGCGCFEFLLRIRDVKSVLSAAGTGLAKTDAMYDTVVEQEKKIKDLEKRLTELAAKVKSVS